ncbi:MAG: DNA-formamidopyrimidine glycosylase family protein [Alphaproteobacteria bacterium]
MIVDFENSMSIIIHLGMSGRLKIIQINDPLKNHDHLVFKFNNIQLTYNDPRRFGFIDIVESDKINNIKYIKKLGIDALDKKSLSRIFVQTNFINQKF